MARVIGDNHHGNDNELDLVYMLDGKSIIDLNSNLKEFVKYVCLSFNLDYDESKVIYSEYENNPHLKQDLYIIIEDNKFGISLKMGTGNSVHQEKCEDFIQYISENFEASKELCDNIRLFTWADGTLDGSGSLKKDPSGNIISRFDAPDFKKRYPEERANIQMFLNDNEEELIKHFLLDGRHGSKVDLIYHGTPVNGSWISADSVVQYQLDNSRSKNPEDKSCLSVGRMTLQVWNRSLKGTSDHKRGEIQLKYGDMKEDFMSIMKSSADNIGTFYGSAEEFDLSRQLNRNKSNNMWNNFELNVDSIDDIYVVKIDKKVKSKLSKKLVSPKADAYLVVAQPPEDYLLSKEYVLTEDEISKFEHSIIKGSGISVKLKDSKKYTIQKFTENSFCKAFEEYLGDDARYVFAGLLVYSDKKEMYKNNRILSDLNIDSNQFKAYFYNKLENSTIDFLQKESMDSVRKKSQDITKETIVNNSELSEAIFTGYGWFDNPYYAKYIYKEGKIETNSITDFIITTGSGRSKGIYSIEIKPKH